VNINSQFCFCIHLVLCDGGLEKILVIKACIEQYNVHFLPHIIDKACKGIEANMDKLVQHNARNNTRLNIIIASMSHAWSILTSKPPIFLLIRSLAQKLLTFVLHSSSIMMQRNHTHLWLGQLTQNMINHKSLPTIKSTYEWPTL
jgi:hypothetical protein